jgi:hypothetical protein
LRAYAIRPLDRYRAPVPPSTSTFRLPEANSTRQLYSDLNETIINVQRPIILNGIAELATRGDLLDRSIVISLPTVDTENRRDEAEFWAKFETAKPKLFGALLDALAAALAQLPHIKLARKPRMADFALFGVAVERALGWPTGTFINAYYANQASANCSAMEASPVALAVQALVENGRVFEGTATDLLNELPSYVDEQARTHRGWPDSGWKLGCILRRLAPSLRTSGVEVTTGERKPDHKRTRVIRIAKTASYASSTSSIAETQPNMRTHLDAWVGSSDETPQPCPRISTPKACVADALDAADAPAYTSMVRGEI